MINLEKYYYDRLLMSGSKSIDASIFYNFYIKGGGEIDSNCIRRDKRDERTALAIIRYAFDYYLGWTPEYTMDNISIDILEKMRLLGIAKRKINYPPEMDAENSPWLYYLVCQMYPDTFIYDSTSAVESYYEYFLKSRQKEKSFFDSSPEGKKRAYICLQYALRKEGVLDAESAYKKFISPGIKPWIRNQKLSNFFNNNFGEPIEFLHAALPRTDANEREYQKARFELIRKEARRRYRQSR